MSELRPELKRPELVAGGTERGLRRWSSSTRAPESYMRSEGARQKHPNFVGIQKCGIADGLRWCSCTVPPAQFFGDDRS